MGSAKAQGEEVARPVNEERGEITLVLDGAEMCLRPSWEAIQSFEAGTGKGLLELARDALNKKLSVADTAQVVCECVKAWGRATQTPSLAGVNAPRIAQLILESEGGFFAVLNRVGGLLALATTGGYTAQGEVKAGTTTTSGAPAGS